jgi:hypothetical protein
MFEFNGWIVVRSNEGTIAADGELVDELREWLDAMDESIRTSFILPEHSVNGHRPLLLSGLRNHYWHEVEETLRWVAERSGASYGVVHLYDATRHDGRSAFVVLTLRGGRVEEHDDPFHLM